MLLGCMACDDRFLAPTMSGLSQKADIEGLRPGRPLIAISGHSMPYLVTSENSQQRSFRTWTLDDCI